MNAGIELLKKLEEHDYGMRIEGEITQYEWEPIWKKLLEINEAWVQVTNQTGELIGGIYINTSLDEENILEISLVKDKSELESVIKELLDEKDL